MIKLVDLLKEQSNPPVKLDPISPWTSDKQRDIYKDYNTYLLNKVGLSWDSPVGEIEKKLKLVTDKQLEDMGFMEFFKEKGYDPGSPEIRQFQKDLKIDQMKTQSGEDAFADGNFGAVTAKAALEKNLLPSVKRTIDKNGANFVFTKDKDKMATGSKEDIIIPKTSTASADVGTQSVPK